jgi:hypothetical protein
MLSHKRTLLVGLTWLTAAATLFAGLPQEACLCPSTSEQATCATPAPSTSSCCCGHSGPCDSGASCCHQPVPKESSPSYLAKAKTDQGQDYRIEGTRCTRGVVHATHPTTVSAPTDSKLSIASAATLCPTPILVTSPPSPTVSTAPARALAPPVDLICLLQHLVI